MRVFEDHGVIIEDEERIAIDPHSKKIVADKIFVSHAHSDHVNIGARNPATYFMSPPTHGLIAQKIPKAALFHRMEQKTTMQGKIHKICLENSGHILGSSQVVVEGEKKVCVTTDFKLQDSILQKGAEIIPCDTLVIESTFGLKQFSFPSRESVYGEMEAWIRSAQKSNHLAILAGYATGKAQELTKIVNEYSTATPFVHDSIFDKNKIHDSFASSLGDYVKIDHNLHEAEVLILPPSLCAPSVLHALSVSARKPVVSAKATGWTFKESYERIFALSDHADYAQLMEYVKNAQPKQVFTDHGFASELAHSIQKELHIPARPLEEAKQLALAQYA